MGSLPFASALARVAAAAWLMAGVAGLCVALMGVLNAVLVRVGEASLVPTDDGDLRPMSVGAIALAMLALFAAARLMPALRAFTRLPSAAIVSTAGAVGFGGVGIVLLAYGALGIALGHPEEFSEHLTQGVAGIVAGLVFLPHAWRQVSLGGVSEA